MNQFAQTRDEVALIEDWHRTMLQLIEKINCCREFELPENFKILVFALEQIFGNEQRLMEKSNFPAIKCHLEQHARVLGALHHVHSSVMRGDIGLARRVGSQLLFDWFNLHSKLPAQFLGEFPVFPSSSFTQVPVHRKRPSFWSLYDEIWHG